MADGGLHRHRWIQPVGFLAAPSASWRSRWWKFNAWGEIAARPGKYPGFLFDRLTATQKKQISQELHGFRKVTAHLPYTGLNYMHPDPAQRAASVRTLEVAMEGAGHFGVRVAVLHTQPLPPDEVGDR